MFEAVSFLLSFPSEKTKSFIIEYHEEPRTDDHFATCLEEFNDWQVVGGKTSKPTFMATTKSLAAEVAYDSENAILALDHLENKGSNGEYDGPKERMADLVSHCKKKHT